MNAKIKGRLIAPSASLLEAMKQMDERKVKMLFVFPILMVSIPFLLLCIDSKGVSCADSD